MPTASTSSRRRLPRATATSARPRSTRGPTRSRRTSSPRWRWGCEMKFDLSEEQQLLADSVQRFLERDYTFEKRKAVVASDAGYSPDAWKAIADLGLLALPIPTEHGGFGGTAVDVMPVMERFGGALVVEPYLSTLMCARMVGHPRAGGDPSLPAAIAEGAMKLAFAHTEDGARYDLSHVAATARREGDGYVLDGVKRVVMHGPQADRLVVSARTSG